MRLALILLFIIGRAFGCTCTTATYAPACEKLASTKIIFVGTIQRVEPDPRHPTEQRARLYQVNVETVYKGLPANSKTVIVDPLNFTSCQASFERGRKYLIFGGVTPGGHAILSGVCSGSKQVEYAAEDLAFLETYRLNKARNYVSGRVLKSSPSFGTLNPDEEVPVAGAEVVLDGPIRKLTQRTSDTGEFRFNDVPPGNYTLLASKRLLIPSPTTIKVEVPPVGCVVRYPQLLANAKLSGTLVDWRGIPMPGKRVELLRKNSKGGWTPSYYRWENTNTHGNFSFKELPDGDYLLGYEIHGDRPSEYSPYPTTYFPGVSKRANSTTIHLIPRQEVKGLRIRLGKPHTPRQIRVKVVWPDGSSPTSNLLQLSSGNSSIVDVGGNAIHNKHALHNGIIEFTGYEERAYDLNVRYWIDDLANPGPVEEKRIARSEVVHLAPGTSPVSVKLVLTRTLRRGDDR